MNDQSLYLLTEAAERTGLTVEALRQRVKRGKLDAVKGNDGMLRVRLTTADLEAIDRSSTSQSALGLTGQPVNDDRLMKALQDAAEARGEAIALRERAEMAEARADRAEAAAAVVPELRERVGRAEGRAAAAEEFAERRSQELAQAQGRAGQAEGVSVALRDQVTAEREHATIERARAETSARELEAARAALADWTAGGPLARAWRAFVNQRGRA